MWTSQTLSRRAFFNVAASVLVGVGWKRGSLSLPEVRLGWNHLLVQDAHDQYLPDVCYVKHDVLAVLESAQAWVQKIATSTQRWVICE